jgi:hypothetical protein
MSKLRFASIGLLLAAIGLTAVPTMVGITSTAYAAETFRPEVGKPLQAAQELLKNKKYKEALAKLRELDNVPGKTPNEIYAIEFTRASAASQTGDYATAVKSYESVLNSGKLPAGQQVQVLQALGSFSYQAHDYPKAITYISRYLKEGGNDPAMRALLTQTYFQTGDYAQAVKDTQAQVQADEKAGRVPSEQSLSLLANAADKTKDKALYVSALEKLVNYYSKKEYWANLLNAVHNKPGFSPRLEFDLYRLKFALGQLQTTEQYMEASQLSLQEGFPAEAMKIIDQGFKSGALGTGAEAERHKRLRDLAQKKLAEQQKTIAQDEKEADAAPEGEGLIKVGYAYVTLGQNDKGLDLIQRGLKKDSLKHPEDAKLHAGIAMLQAGHKQQAIQTLKTVKGNDGTADLARYWIMYANSRS